MAFFSIIVPVYKTEKYLEQCVRSVLNQSFKDYELILVDDGSPDGCPEKCDRYAKEDSKIKVFHKKNGGLSDARNYGIDNSTGKYVLFLDSDDYWDDLNALQKVYDKISLSSSDVLVFGIKKYMQETGKYIGSKIGNESIDLLETDKGKKWQQLMKHNLFIASACDKAISRNLIDEKKMRFVIGQASEDIEWCAKLLLAEAKIDYLNEDFYVYRIQKSNTLSTEISFKNVNDTYEVIKKYVSILEKDTTNTMLSHYLALQYVLLLTNMERLNQKEIVAIARSMKEYWHLLQFDYYPYVKKVKLVRWVGYQGIRRLLKLYWTFRRG